MKKTLLLFCTAVLLLSCGGNEFTRDYKARKAAHGVNERDWLEDVLRRIPEYELGKKDFTDLLPGNWAPATR